MLYLPGIGEVPISICGISRDGRAVEHAIRSVGAVTAALTKLRPGESVGVRGPFGNGWPLDDSEGCDLLIIAGGIGLAPLRPAIQAAARRKGGRVIVLYGARSPEDLLFRRDLAAWSRQGVEASVIVDRAGSGWRGRIGLVTELIAPARPDPTRTQAWLCGPEIMMRFCINELQRLGLKRIYLSLERNMKCGVGHCGHCQLGELFVCKDGPVVSYDLASDLMAVEEL
jgi:NAD(P)H-flavin reductase